jgi:hypothetical protein
MVNKLPFMPSESRLKASCMSLDKDNGVPAVPIKQPVV